MTRSRRTTIREEPKRASVVREAVTAKTAKAHFPSSITKVRIQRGLIWAVTRKEYCLLGEDYCEAGLGRRPSGADLTHREGTVVDRGERKPMEIQIA